MTLLGVAVRNVRRNKFRVSLTIVGVGVAVVAFLLLRTTLSAWNVGVEAAAKDRLGTRHKVSFVISLPKRYIDDVRAVPGVKAATWASWFGAKNPKDPNDFFASFAVDPESYLQVIDEMVVKPEDRARWLADKKGALVGDVLARKLGVKVGDHLTLPGTIYAGDWDFNIDGIYTATRKTVDRSQFVFRWDYLNDSLSGGRKDKIGWIVSRIDDPRRGPEISQAIDRMFDSRDAPTLTMSEKAMQLSFMGMMSAILTALDIVSAIILVIMTMILGNTIAMGVRERTTEYGVLRAIGFLPKHVAAFIVGEAMTIGLCGGALGLLLGYPIIQQGMGRWLEENMGGMFPYFRIEPKAAVLAVVLSAALGAVAAALPASGAARLKVVDALRRVG